MDRKILPWLGDWTSFSGKICHSSKPQETVYWPNLTFMCTQKWRETPIFNFSSNSISIVVHWVIYIDYFCCDYHAVHHSGQFNKYSDVTR